MLTDKHFCSNHHDWGGCCHIDHSKGKKTKLLVCHPFEPQTSRDKCEINVPSMGIELAAIGQLAVGLANCTTANFGDTPKMSVYIQT